ncbi:trigger factor [Corynebacterium xerosis]|uniref:Trigger factor n=1 Tax=Corynebacterium xerosis TaxID=1725 RepID=A0ABV3UVY3_9CORY|nr:trigger factor [Corynebacterium xerosis]KKO81930.1 trigger factor [Corynebacterium xerosis]SQB94736.1 trigger factor Tig [Clostridium paraputrificum]HJG56210.1 trigger factor [Corynebacterium xerosis]
MKSSVEQQSATRVKITVEVPFDELKPEFDKAHEALSQQVQIPGFRKGKAPAKLIEARVGRGPILEQVLNEMVPSRYGQAVEEHDLKVIGQPEVDVTKLEDGDVVEFTAEVDVRPEIELPDFSDISVEVDALKADDEAVQSELDNLLARFGTLTGVERAVEDGDFISIDLSATVDGEELEEASTEGLSYQVGSGDLIDGLDEAVTGLAQGESKEFGTKLVAGDHEGEDAQVTVTVQSVKVRQLPDADDEFAQMASEFDTIDELREDLAKQVENTKKGEQAQQIRDKVLAAALEKTEVPLPEGVVKEQVDGQLQQLLGQFGGDEAVLNSMLEAQGTTREQFDADSRTSAEEAVRTQLFLDELAEAEQPEVSQQELTDHILFTAQSYGMDPNQFIQQIQQSGQLGNLFADVRRGKALAVSILKATVKDTDGNDIDVAEFFGEAEAADADNTEAKADEAADAEK